MIRNFPGRTKSGLLTVPPAESFFVPVSLFPVALLLPGLECIGAGNKTSCPNKCGSYKNPDLWTIRPRFLIAGPFSCKGVVVLRYGKSLTGSVVTTTLRCKLSAVGRLSLQYFLIISGST